MDVTLRRAAVRATLSRNAEAAALVREGAEDPGADDERAGTLAAALWNSGNAEGALALARRVAQRTPSSADAQHRLAWLELQRGAPEAALAAARRASELDAAGIPRLLLHAAAALRVGATGEAREVAARIVALEPEEPRAHELLGHAAAQARLPDDASTHYHRAIEIEPRSYPAHAGIAIARELTGRWRLAIDARLASLKVDSSDPDAYRGIVSSVAWILRPWRVLAVFGLAAFLLTSPSSAAPTVLVLASVAGLVVAIVGYVLYRRARRGLPPEALQAYAKTVEERNYTYLDIGIGLGAYLYLRIAVAAAASVLDLARGLPPPQLLPIPLALVVPVAATIWWFVLRKPAAVPSYLYQDV
jgi:tetratricopeptide (TPR) repeat protein